MELECKVMQGIRTRGGQECVQLCAGFASPKQMVILKDIIEAGESLSHVRLISGRDF